jgi:hypothetical protein
VEFDDVTNNWAKEAINDMGSRMVVTGVGNNIYKPDRIITRAEVAAIAVRAMGLAQGAAESGYADVSLSDWFNGYVDTAAEYGIITGYTADSFGPNDVITREQVMTILARVMEQTGLSTGLTDSEVSAILDQYTDGAEVSDFARAGVAAAVQSGVVNGTGDATLSPKAYVTRAEVTVMIQRLLQQSKLI